MNVLLWIIQILLALLFLFSGVVKLVTPVAEMTKQMVVPLPGLFLQFIGVCEVLGAVGLVLPALLRIKPSLTPFAALCLAVITLGATGVTLAGGAVMLAVFPLIVCLLCVLVAYGRFKLAPVRAKSP